MLDTLAALPFWQAFLALFASAMVRSNGTYWVGRGAIAGWRRHRGTHGDLTGRAEAMLRRFGPFAVTLSYLTVGIQTAIHLTTGVMRMPLRYYLPAAVAGSAAVGRALRDGRSRRGAGLARRRGRVVVGRRRPRAGRRRRRRRLVRRPGRRSRTRTQSSEPPVPLE